MKRAILKMITMVLAGCMILLSVPLPIFSLEARAEVKKGEEFSANTYFAGRLQEIFDLLVYGDAPYFTTFGVKTCGNTHCDDCKLSNVCESHPTLANLGVHYDSLGYGSMGFARFVYTRIFNEVIPSINFYGNPTSAALQTLGRIASGDTGIIGSYETLTEEHLKGILSKGSAGDLIQARSQNGENHTMVFLKTDDEGVWVLHTIDFDDGTDEYNRAVISKYTFGEMTAKWNQVISLLRAKESTYRTAVNKGINEHTIHTYTDEGGDYCTICGEQVFPTLSSACAGVYAAKWKTTVYKSYYRSSGSTGRTVSENAFVTAVGSVRNAAGTVFYFLTDGGYVCADDFEEGRENVPTIAARSYPSGILTQGESFSLSLDVSDKQQLTSVSGYLIKDSAEVVQMQTVSTGVDRFSVSSSRINSALRFGSLSEGNYIFMLTATSVSGRMASFVSGFEVRKPAEKPTPSTPTPPVLKQKSATSVILEENAGYEYRIDDEAWQSSPVFEGLLSGTTYRFYRRKAENENYKASASSLELLVTTDKSEVEAPQAPALRAKTDKTITVYELAGIQYSIDNGGSWQNSGLFTGLLPGVRYTIVARYAETVHTFASPASEGLVVTTNKSVMTAPSAPTVRSVTDRSITLYERSGLEYSIDGGENWQKSGYFEGLESGTAYTFVARYAETDATYPSPASAKTTAKTDKAVVSAPAAPILADKTYNSITLAADGRLEYSIDGGNTWQKSPVFTGLSPATEYVFVARYAESEKVYASGAGATLTVKTEKAPKEAPAAPKLVSIVGYTVTFEEQSGIEYSFDGSNWQSSGVFRVENYGEKHFYARYAETETTQPSSPSSDLCVTVNPLALTSDSLKVDEEKLVVYGLSVTMTAAELFDCFPENEYLVLRNSSGDKVDSDATVYTGMRLCLAGGKEYLLGVRGDVNGDGKINVFDLTSIKNEILSGGILSDERFSAADVNGDGRVDVFDYVAIKNKILAGETV